MLERKGLLAREPRVQKVPGLIGILIRTPRFLTLLLVSQTIYLGYAQRQWNLDSCLNYAREHHPRLQLRQSGQQRAQLELELERRQLLPSVGLSLSQDWSYGRSQDVRGLYIDRSSAHSGLALSGQLPIASLILKVHALKMRRLGVDLASYELANEALQLDAKVTSLYFSYLYAQQRAEVQRQQLRLVEGKSQQGEAMLRVGRWSRLDLLDLEGQHSRELLALEEAEHGRKRAYLELFGELGMQDEDMCKIQLDTIPMATSMVFDSAGARQRVLALSPRLAAYSKQSEISRLRYQQVRWSALPSLTLSGGYSNSYYRLLHPQPSDLHMPLSDQWRSNGRYYLNLQLSVSITQLFHQSKQLRLAQQELREHQLRERLATQQLSQELDQLLLDARLARKSLSLSEDVLRQAWARYQAVDRSFDAGRSTLLELSEARLNVKRAQLEHYRLRNELALKCYLLRQLLE